MVRALWPRVKRALHRVGLDVRRLPRDAPAWRGPYIHQVYDAICTSFVHVPKTGGTSIEHSLEPHLDKPFAGGHTTAAQFALICPAEWRDYFSFGFVRNPWDRLLSAYRYLMQLPPELGIEQQDFVRQRWLRYENDFEGFVGALAAEPTSIFFVAHLWPQVYYLCDPSGEVMVDFVGRYERLHEDWARVCHRIGIEAPLPHLRRTSERRPPYTAVYTPRSREQVATLYRQDIEAFGYEFDSGAA